MALVYVCVQSNGHIAAADSQTPDSTAASHEKDDSGPAQIFAMGGLQ